MDDLWAWFQCIVNSHCRQYWGISKNLCPYWFTALLLRQQSVRKFLLLVGAFIRRRISLVRCSFVFDEVSLAPCDVLTLAKLDLKFHIRVDFARLSVSSFRKRYAFQNGVVRVLGCDLSLDF